METRYGTGHSANATPNMSSQWRAGSARRAGKPGRRFHGPLNLSPEYQAPHRKHEARGPRVTPPVRFGQSQLAYGG